MAYNGKIESDFNVVASILPWDRLCELKFLNFFSEHVSLKIITYIQINFRIVSFDFSELFYRN